MRARARSSEVRTSTSVGAEPASRLASASAAGDIRPTGGGALGLSILNAVPWTVSSTSIESPFALCADATSSSSATPFDSARISCPSIGPRLNECCQRPSMDRCTALPGLAWSALPMIAAAASLTVTSGGVRSGASAPSISCSSPLLNICFTMSQPPTNSRSM